jgi:hypothetical protein
LPYFPRCSQPAGAAKTQAASTFSITCAIAAQNDRATFALLPGAREFGEENVSKLVRDEKQENYHRIVSAHPSYRQEFDTVVPLLNFVNAV